VGPDPRGPVGPAGLFGRGSPESWEPRKDDPTKWVFKLRKGSPSTDGSECNADAVVFVESIKEERTPPHSTVGSGRVSFRMGIGPFAVTKIDDPHRGVREPNKEPADSCRTSSDYMMIVFAHPVG